MNSRELKPEWHQALVIWAQSQEDEEPPRWTHFFLQGLSLRSVLERLRKVSPSSKRLVPSSTANGLYNPSSSGGVRPGTERTRFHVRPRILFQGHSSPARLPSCDLVDEPPLESATPTSRRPSLLRVQTTPSKIPKTMEPDEAPLTTLGKPIFGLESSCSQVKTTTEALVAEDRGKNPGSNNKRHFRRNNIQTSVRKSMTRDYSATDEESDAESDSVNDQQLLDNGDSGDDEDSDYQPSAPDSAESSEEEELTDEELARDQEEVALEVKGLISPQHAFLNNEVELTSSIESLEVGQICSADQKELSRKEGKSSEDGPADIESAEDDLTEAVSWEREQPKGRGAKKPPIKIGCTAKARLWERKERSAKRDTDSVKRSSAPLSGHALNETSITESTSSYWGTSSKSICFGMAPQKASQDHLTGSFWGLDLTAVKCTALSKRTKSGGRNHI